MGFSDGSDDNESTRNEGTWVQSCVGKIPWRRVWQPTQVFLPEESPWTKDPGGLQSMGTQRVGHN